MIHWTEEEIAKVKVAFAKVSAENPSWSFQSKIHMALDELPKERHRSFASESVLPWNEPTRKPYTRRVQVESSKSSNWNGSKTRLESAMDMMVEIFAEEFFIMRAAIAIERKAKEYKDNRLTLIKHRDDEVVKALERQE